jgi:hypothetical protein
MQWPWLLETVYSRRTDNTMVLPPAIVLSVLLLYTVSNYPGHCLVRPLPIYGF